MQLESPELVSRLERARLRAAGLNEEIARIPANAVQRERRLVLEQQLGESLADEAGAEAELAQLTVLAPHAGVVRDLSPGLIAGRWVQARQALMRVVAQEKAEIDAYVDEQLLQSVEIGQRVRFYPDLPEAPVISGSVVAVDPAAGRIVPVLLASPNGGQVAATRTAQGNLVAHEALYRVRIQPDPGEPGTLHVAKGSVRIDSGLHLLAWRAMSRAASVLVRESGF